MAGSDMTRAERALETGWDIGWFYLSTEDRRRALVRATGGGVLLAELPTGGLRVFGAFSRHELLSLRRSRPPAGANLSWVADWARFIRGLR